MKTFRIVALLFIVFLSKVTSSSAAPIKISVGIESNDFSPYTFGTKSNYKGQGALVDLLKSFEKEIGVKFSFRVLPWKRCLRMLKQNKLDAVFNASFKKERTKIGVYPILNGEVNTSRGTHSSNYVLYTKKKSNLKWSGKKFIGLNGLIGAERGFSIVSDLKKVGADVKEVGDATKGLIMTQKNRLQGFVTLESPGDFAFKNLDKKYKKDLTKFSLPVKSKRYYIIFSHKFANSQKATLEKIWKSIEKSNQNGLSKKLINDWLKKIQ